MSNYPHEFDVDDNGYIAIQGDISKEQAELIKDWILAVLDTMPKAWPISGLDIQLVKKLT